MHDLGEHHLKDLEQPVSLFQVVIAGLPADFLSPRTRNRSSDTFPAQLPPLIGREHEVTTVVRLLRRADVRLVTLTGPGGTGKTRLALQVASMLVDVFAGGMFFVSLASIRDPVLVMPTIARALGLRDGVEQSVFARLAEMLQRDPTLLLLDNFEQVLEAALQLADLLASCPQLKLLVTSREVLHIRSEREFAVPPLALPDLARPPKLAALARTPAVALFLQRAQAASPEFKLTSANAERWQRFVFVLMGFHWPSNWPRRG